WRGTVRPGTPVSVGRRRAGPSDNSTERVRSREPGQGRHMNVGIIGWRGMVGSVLVQRMREERDFDLIDPVFFSTSQAGAAGPEIGKRTPAVKDANDPRELAAMDVLISCQGGEYTADMHPKLRKAGWTGHWIDAARHLRMADRSEEHT